jgi:DNA-binding transcriptional LysR family regulator
MEMQQVRYFLAVARQLNFTRAAEECNVTQPSLTRAIKALEDELGGLLIRREGRHSHLTDLGVRMEPMLRTCFESALTAKSVAAAMAKGEVTSLTLAVARSVDLGLLMKPIGALFDAFPGLQLKVKRGNAAEVAEMLKAGTADIAVGGPLNQSWERLDSWPMFTESFDLVVSADHPLAVRNDPSLDVELVRRSRVLVQSDDDMSDADLARLSATGVPVELAHQVDAVHDMEALVTANLALAIAPASSLGSTALRHIPLSAIDLRRTVAVYLVAGRQRTPQMGALLHLLRGTDWEAGRETHWESENGGRDTACLEPLRAAHAVSG